MSLEVRNLSFQYIPGRPILRNMSFTAGEGKLLSVLGPNGVGKSTLFRCMLGLQGGYQGSITLNGRDVQAYGTRELARTIAYIPQSHYPTFNYSVLDMVLMGTTAQSSGFSPPGREQERLALEALEKLGISDFAHRFYTQISGGERQLVLIARALAQQSRILVMDEPTANLDYGNQMRVMTQVRALTGEGYTVIQSTHSPDQAYLFAPEIRAVQTGQVLAQGPPAQVLDEKLIYALYGIEVEVAHLCDDKFRACVPRQLLNQQ